MSLQKEVSIKVLPQNYLLRILEINQAILAAIEEDDAKLDKFATIKKKLDLLCLEIEAGGNMPEEEHIQISIAYYNLAKLADSHDTLGKAILNLTKTKKHFKFLAVLQSSACKEHMIAYNLVSSVASQILGIFKKIVGNSQKREEMGETVAFLEDVIELAEDSEKDQVIWIDSEKNMKEIANRTIAKLKSHGRNSGTKYPFYPKFNFQIADIMSMHPYTTLKDQQEELLIREYIMMLSICFFTKATQKFYMQDYSDKLNHIKALRIALVAFDLNCKYSIFLTNILIEHFGKELTPIHEDRLEVEDYSELCRIVPRDLQEVRLDDLVFADY